MEGGGRTAADGGLSNKSLRALPSRTRYKNMLSLFVCCFVVFCCVCCLCMFVYV